MTPSEKEISSEGTQPDLDKAKFDLEKWQIEEDLNLRRDELEIKRKELSKSRWSSPLMLAIIGLSTSVVLSIIQNYWQSTATRELERQRFESALIQKALDASSKEQAADRFQSYLALGLVKDEAIRAQIERYISKPESIPLSNAPLDDMYQGTVRSAAKLSVGTGSVEKFNDLQDLIVSLPPDATMISHQPPILTDASSGRVSEEQRNVAVRAFLYAASKDESNDFSLIIGRDPNSQPEMYMIMRVAGLPPSSDPNYAKEKATRDVFKTFFKNESWTGGYIFLDPPVPVEIEGSLLFDVAHVTGQRPGPKSLKSRLPTLWQVHPITKIVLPLQSIN